MRILRVFANYRNLPRMNGGEAANERSAWTLACWIPILRSFCVTDIIRRPFYFKGLLKGYGQLFL